MTPDVSSYTWIVALSASIRMTSASRASYTVIQSYKTRLRTPDKFVMSYTDEFVHGRAGHVLCNHDGARDTEDLAEAGLAFFISDLGQVPLRVLKGAGHGGGWERREKADRKAQSLAMDERRQGRLTTVLHIRRAAAGPEPSAFLGKAPTDQALVWRLRVD